MNPPKEFPVIEDRAESRRRLRNPARQHIFCQGIMRGYVFEIKRVLVNFFTAELGEFPQQFFLLLVEIGGDLH